jgi:hypothetical protein
MDYIRLPDSAERPTFWDRCTSAFYAFRMQVKPDMQKVFDQLQEMQDEADEEQLTLEDKRAAAFVKLDPFTQSQIHSVAGATDLWREMYDQAMLFVDTLPVEDQLTIMQYIFAGNRRIVQTQRFRQWMAQHADAILDHMEK